MKELLSVLLCGLCAAAGAWDLTRQFHFVNESLNWTEAQQFCRKQNTDLATVSSRDDINKLLRPASYSGDAWIGLFSVIYQKWAPGEPRQGLCMGMSNDGMWHGNVCTRYFYFVCYIVTHTGEKIYTLVTWAYHSWAGAQTFCRASYTDLALIENEAENKKVATVVYPNYAWIGLNTGPWQWSDSSSMNFTNWLSGYPLRTLPSCAVEDQNHYWRDKSCDQRLPFFCYKDVKLTVVRISLRSDLDLTDLRTYRIVSEQMQEKLNQTGHSGLIVTWESPLPKKTDYRDSVLCPADV